MGAEAGAWDCLFNFDVRAATGPVVCLSVEGRALEPPTFASGQWSAMECDDC